MRINRIIAYVIDAILVSIVIGILGPLFGMHPTTLWTNNAGIEILYNPTMLFSTGIFILYFLTDVMMGGSPGKKLLKLSVTGNTGIGAALIRSVVKMISIGLIIGIILFFVFEDGSSLHDKAAGTRVQRR